MINWREGVAFWVIFLLICAFLVALRIQYLDPIEDANTQPYATPDGGAYMR